MKENFTNKFLNKIKFTINDQLMKDFATRFTNIKNNNNNNNDNNYKTLLKHHNKLQD